MTRKSKLLLGCAVALILLVGAVVLWQWDNITSLVTGLRYSQAELEEQMQQNDQKIQDAVADVAPQVTIRDLTDEEKQALKDGSVTQQELIQNLITPTPKPVMPTEKPPSEKEPQQPSVVEPEPEPEPDKYEQELSALIAEVYVLREEFLIKLDNLLAQAKAEYTALSPEERTASKLLAMAGNYMAVGLDLEKQCDAQVEDIVLRLDALVQENGGDTSIAQKVYDTYVNEKSLKKAWYMAELKKRGLV